MRAYEAYPVFLDYLNAEAGNRLLDIGCGTGFLLKAGSRRGLKTYGVDMSEEAVTLAKRVSSQSTVLLGTGEQLPFKDGLFDYVTCIGTLEHFLGMEKGLKEIKRVSRKDAQFCLMVPNSKSIQWQTGVVLGANETDCNENAFSLQEWTDLFTHCGFEISGVYRDRWYVKKVLAGLSLSSFTTLQKITMKVIRPILPLKYAGELIFLLRKGNHHDSARVSRFYDRLSRYALFANSVKYRDRYAKFTMHKTLGPLGEQVGVPRWESKLTYVDDLALHVADLPLDPTVLDAGCGFGGTVFRWQEKVKGSYHGVTLSQVQVAVARGEARRRGVDSSCYFYSQSYDAPFPRIYDAIVAIESLIHSKDFKKTIRNLADALKPGGRLVVVDDVLAGDGNRSDDDIEVLEKCWGLATIPSEKDYGAAFRDNHLEMVRELDLSDRIEARHSRVLGFAGMAYRTFRAIVPVRAVRSVLSAQWGGVALERLHLRGNVRYKLFVGRKGL